MSTEHHLRLFLNAMEQMNVLKTMDVADQQLIHFLRVHSKILAALPEVCSLLKTTFDGREAFWDSGVAYFDECAQILENFHQQMSHQEEKPPLPLLSSISMEWLHIQQWQICWRASNAFMPTEDFWHKLYHFYQKIQATAYFDMSHSPLTGLMTKSTPQIEFKCLLILSVSGLDSFRSDEIVYVLRLTKLLSNQLIISEHYEDRYRFGLNLQGNKMPSIIRDREPKDRNMFFTIPDFTTRFQSAIQRLGPYRDLPEAAQLRVRHIINQQWGMKKENRRMYERKKVDFTLHIAIGYEAALKIIPLERTPISLSALVNEGTLSERQVSSAEAKDMSIGGFGITIADFQKTPIVIGSLVTLEIPNAASWRLGIVRRVRRINKNEAFIGIQLISSEAFAAPVTQEGQKVTMALVLPDLKQKEDIGIILPPHCTNYASLRIDSLTENSSCTYQPQADVWMSGPLYQLVGGRKAVIVEKDTLIHDWFNEK